LSVVRNFVVTFLLSLLIFGLIAYGLVQFTVSAFELGVNRSENAETEAEGTRDPDDTGDAATPPDWLHIKGESFTVLLVGTDYQPNVYDDYGSTDKVIEGFPAEPRRVEADSITLVRVNKETGECLFCPIPAITKIVVDGLSCQLQDLYAMKGIGALCDKIMAMTGIPVDFYAVVTMDSFAAFIDDLGGLPYFVPKDMYYKDESIGLEINIRRGSQKLNGTKAVQMLQYWSYDDGDTSRRACAVNFLKELFKRIVSQIEPGSAAFHYYTYSKYFETNFTLDHLRENVDLLFAYNKMIIVDYTYPGTTVGQGGDAYFSANIQKAIEDFSKYKFKG
jgi:LCP family protein required for cell wall assembly